MKMNINKLEESKTFDLTEASRISGVKKDQFILFYTMLWYIKKESYGYSATALGIEKGCVINDDKYNVLCCHSTSNSDYCFHCE